MVKGLELANLRRMCKRNGVDIQHIDSSLTYDENKERLHLISIEEERCPEVDTLEWYEKELKKKDKEIKALRKFIKRYVA